MRLAQAQRALNLLIAGDEDGCAQLLRELIADAASAPAPADANQVAARRLKRVTNTQSADAALVEVERWRQSHHELEAQRAELACERAALEADERARLVRELDVAGVATSSSAYARMPIADLRDAVAEHRAARRAPNRKRA